MPKRFLNNRKYTANELEKLPTISQGQFDNLKIETEDTRVWLSRMTIDDGMPYNNAITIEKLEEGRWIIIEEYAG